MPTEVIMPQMGESIFEGTLTKWLKKPGEKVQRDEPLFEISTDKVDAEIPAPVSGVLKEIKVPEGTTVQVNAVVGVIDAEGPAAAEPAPRPAKAAEAPSAPPAVEERPTPPSPPKAAPPAEKEPARERPRPTEAPARRAEAPSAARGDGGAVAPREGEEETEVPTYLRQRAAVEPAARPKEERAVEAQRETVIEFPAYDRDLEGRRIRSSPLVRRIARDHGVSLAQVPGTGLGGRITKDDILSFIEQHPGGAPAAAPRPAAAVGAPMPMPTPTPAVVPGEVVPMTVMRKKIAEHMVLSKRTSAHVHSIFEINMTRIVRLREQMRADWEKRNATKLTYMPFFARAVMEAMRQFPIINSSVEGESIRYHRAVNLGIAVALDWGLIVPVVKNAEEKNFLGLQRAITDLAERARTKKLRPEEVQGGTFTITNPGVYGPLFGLPIINQPQVAILGIGGIFKTPIVKTDNEGNDYVAIGHIVHVSLGYDHRVVDGAVADQFLAAVKKKLESWDEDIG